MPSKDAGDRAGSSGRVALFGALAVLLLGGGFVYGYLAHRNGLFPASLIRRWSEPARLETVDGPPGRWDRAVLEGGGEAVAEEIERLRSIGYLSGADAAPATSGILVHDAAAARAGLNLYTSGHAPEAILMDMDGAVLHRWHYEFDDVWPAASFDERPGYFEVDYWRRAHLFDNGDLLAIYEGFGIVKLDRDSNLLWSYPRAEAESLLAEPGAHHDMHVDEDGRIYVLTRRAHVVERINPGWPVLEDYITVLGPTGEVIDSLSLLGAFERSPFKTLLGRIAERGDIFHTNTIEILDGRHADRAPIFKRGNALISVRELNVIAIVDMERREVVWAVTGLANKQHQPTLLDSGNMLLFDNFFGPRASRVIEFDPLTQQVLWQYPGEDGVPFFSATCGSNQRLDNGNTLITETDRGRAIEVDAAGNVVWEFLNPQRAGDDDELIASLFEVVRLPPDYAATWLQQ